VTKCYPNATLFSPVCRRRVEVDFSGGHITSHGGALLLREADRRIGLTADLAKILPELRRSSHLVHSQLHLLRQRIFALCLGHEDLNDHASLRHDMALQTAIGRDQTLASASTLCRLEQRAGRDTAWRMHEILIQQFMARHPTPPKQLVLDFDATDIPVHGEQEGRHFHAYYDHYCFLPLQVFCGEHLLVNYLRPASKGAAHHALAVLSLLVKRLRQSWPKVQILFRGDAGFCLPRLLSWCDRARVDYVVGIGKNSRLNQLASPLHYLAEQRYDLEGKPQRHFTDLRYAANSWRTERRVVAKAEHNAQGANHRYVVTSLADYSATHIYTELYCARGDAENMIKAQQELFADRTSSQNWWSNQWRMLLSGMAYTLVLALKHLALKNTPVSRAQIDTLRKSLLNIGGVVVRNTRRVRLLLSSAHPHQDLFWTCIAALQSG